jgi:hypothetical protein
MPDTLQPNDLHAEEADGHHPAGDLIELSLVPAETLNVRSADSFPPLSTEWQATDADWKRLRMDRYERAWKLAALATGLTPAKDIRRRLVNLGREEERIAYLALKSAIGNNLTSDDDPDRLPFVKNAENDGRRDHPDVRSTERVLDVVVFVEFAQRREIDIHPRMIEIARAFIDARASRSRPFAEVSAEQAQANDAVAGREGLTIGLLMMYLRDLAKNRTAPPLSLLKGVNDDINSQALAAAIQRFVGERVDRDGRAAMVTSGASVTTLRKTLGTAKRYFDNIGDE